MRTSVGRSMTLFVKARFFNPAAENLKKGKTRGIRGITATLLFVSLAVPPLQGGCGLEDRSNHSAQTDNRVKSEEGHFPLGFTDVRDLFDMDELTALSLDDLKWNQTGRFINEAGVTILLGEWSSGEFRGVNSQGQIQVIEMKHKAEIYLPPGYPNMSLTRPGKGLVRARHQAKDLKGDYKNIFSAAYALERAAREFGLVTLGHGAEESNWKDLGFDSRNALFIQTLKSAMSLNPDQLNDFQTANHLLELARANIMAMTLLSRVAESEGGSITEFALSGSSKEGMATWVVSAVDDRLVVSAPGAYQLQDIQAFDQFEVQMGCEGDIADLIDVLELLQLRDWLVQSPAGKQYAQFLLPTNYMHLLYPEFLLLSGDVGMWNMHDGWFFPLGAETHFLNHFSEREWHYDRYAGIRESGLPRVRENRMLLLVASRLAFGEDAFAWPQVTKAVAEDNGTEITFLAEAEEASKVHLFWNQSAIRSWNRKEQPAWQKVALTDFNGSWVTTIAPEPGKEVVWYVEAERHVSIGDIETVAKDATPMYFERQLPPKTCSQLHEASCL